MTEIDGTSQLNAQIRKVQASMAGYLGASNLQADARVDRDHPTCTRWSDRQEASTPAAQSVEYGGQSFQESRPASAG